MGDAIMALLIFRLRAVLGIVSRLYLKAAGMMLDKDPDEMLGRFIGDVFPTAWEDFLPGLFTVPVS